MGYQNFYRSQSLYWNPLIMHYSTLLLLGLYHPLVSSAAAISQRSIAQGWSLQASTCPSGSQSCGAGACCPSSLHCFSAKTAEVASCCTSSKDLSSDLIDLIELQSDTLKQVR